MDILGKFRKAKPVESGPRAEDYAYAIASSQGPSPASEEAARQDMGINIHTIEDDRVLKMLDALCVVGSKFQWLNPETGLYEERDISYPRSWAMALRVAVSKVNACRFLTPYEAVTTKLKLRNEVKAIKMTMSRSDLALFGSFINVVLAVYAEPAIDDSVNGQKMLGLKVQSREYQVRLNNNSNQGK